MVMVGRSFLGFTLVTTDLNGTARIEPGPFSWHTSALTTDLPMLSRSFKLWSVSWITAPLRWGGGISSTWAASEGFSSKGSSSEDSSLSSPSSWKAAASARNHSLSNGYLGHWTTGASVRLLQYSIALIWGQVGLFLVGTVSSPVTRRLFVSLSFIHISCVSSVSGKVNLTSRRRWWSFVAKH